MAAPKEKLWKIDDHTRAKHEILGRYLEAWIPILSYGGFPSLCFIDGFAGPGAYEDGSDGSPIIALKAYLRQSANITATVDFHFVERHPKRAEHLRDLVDALLASAGPQPRLRCTIHARMDFATAYEEIVRIEGSPASATFAFIDPFGWKDIPLSLVERVLARPKTEILVNFMFEEINRFLVHPDQVANFDALFGASDWQPVHALSGKERQTALRELYTEKLRVAGHQAHVRHFEMRNKRSHIDYYLFFVTKSLQGLKKMKHAMWKADPHGQFTFSDATGSGQGVLISSHVDRTRLRSDIVRHFAGRTVPVQQVEEFVIAHTAFLDTHHKAVLKEMEGTGALEVVGPKPGRRSGTFANGTLISFKVS